MNGWWPAHLLDQADFGRGEANAVKLDHVGVLAAGEDVALVQETAGEEGGEGGGVRHGARRA